MNAGYTEIGERFLREILVGYHICEEFLIALICAVITLRSFRTARSTLPRAGNDDLRTRIFLVAAAFVILSISSLLHATIHLARLNLNLLYQTLLGYCLGLITLILANAADKPWKIKGVPLLFIPMLLLLLPQMAEKFAFFEDFRPLVWIVVAYLSGIVCMLYGAAYYRTRHIRYAYSAVGHIMICTAAVLLFFPAPIGSAVWFYGHLFRPLGFGILLFSMNREEFMQMNGSMLYRVLTAFSFMAAFPLLIFGSLMFYENISPMHVMGRRFMIFSLLLVTLLSALIFGLGLIIQLVRPIINLRNSVDRLVDEGFERKLEVPSNDEVGQLTQSFNEMTVKLRRAIHEQNRLSRLAATGELAATLAHEIKNPLNAINGAASYIRKTHKGQLVNEFIKVISDEVSRINKLTTSLLSFAKPLKPSPSVLDVNDLVMDTVSLFRQESSEQNVWIKTSMSRSRPLVNCDAAQIKQVLINLLVNSFDAVSAMEDGLIRVSTETSNGSVLISVEDNGTGIRAEDLENIFNPFFTTKTRGTGLGLAISKKILKDHAGELTVQSKRGHGSVFTLVLTGEG